MNLPSESAFKSFNDVVLDLSGRACALISASQLKMQCKEVVAGDGLHESRLRNGDMPKSPFKHSGVKLHDWTSVATSDPKRTSVTLDLHKNSLFRT
jgi:hypothetical protein